MDRLQKELATELSIDDIPKNYRPLAELIGLDKFLLLCDYAKGDELYFPQIDKIFIPVRNRRIKKEFNGYNKKELARKYNLTVVQIGAIIRQD